MTFAKSTCLPAVCVLLAGGGFLATAQEIEVRNESGQAYEITRLDAKESNPPAEHEPAVLAKLLHGSKDLGSGGAGLTLGHGDHVALSFKDLPVRHDESHSRTAKFKISNGKGSERIFYYVQWTLAPVPSSGAPGVVAALELESAPSESKGETVRFVADGTRLTLKPVHSGPSVPAPAPGEFLVINKSGGPIKVTPEKDSGLMASQPMAGTLKNPGTEASGVLKLSPDQPETRTLADGGEFRMNFLRRVEDMEAGGMSIEASFTLADGSGQDAVMHCVQWRNAGTSASAAGGYSIEMDRPSHKEHKGAVTRFDVNGATLVIVKR